MKAIVMITILIHCLKGVGITDSLPQSKDSIPASWDSTAVRGNIEFIYQMLTDEATEHLTEDNDAEGVPVEDYEELLQAYLLLQENPININSEGVVRLEELGLINAFQANSIREYRKRYGNILLINELAMIEDFNEQILTVISPIIYCGLSEQETEQERITVSKLARQGKHQLTMNYAQKLPATEESSEYLGNPLKLQLKYSYQYKSRIKMGFVMEKDAGEPLYYDFIGFHLYANDLRILKRKGREHQKTFMVKDLALGDFLLSFGQGLTLWTGMSLGKAAGGSSLMKRAAGVRPKASASEGKYFRGAATTLRIDNLYATVFYSNRAIDASVSLNDTLEEVEQVSSLAESGYHRTLGELEKRHAIRQQVFGGHLSYATPRLEVGFTGYHLRLSAPLKLKPSKYNQYYFQGDRLTNLGLDFRWTVSRMFFFGEVSRSGNGAFAGLVGVTVKPAGTVNFSLLYRNYDKRYQCLFNGAFGESSRRQGEEGYYAGIQCAPAPRWVIQAYGDLFRLTWPNAQAYSPSWGQEYGVRVEHQSGRNSQMQFRFKSKTKMKNSPDNEVFTYRPVSYTKRTAQFQVSYSITSDLVFTDRVAYCHYKVQNASDSRGYYMSHDIAYRPVGRDYAVIFRYALFGSDDYNSRITVYENDVLGAFSIPSLSGIGTRIYLLGRVRMFNVLSLYARIGLLFKKEGVVTDLKAEMMMKF